MQSKNSASFVLRLLFVLFFVQGYMTAQAKENEKICSHHYNYCFQIPANYFMLHTNDIESAIVGYRTVDEQSNLLFVNGELPQGADFHQLYLMILGTWSELDYQITRKKEYGDAFIISGYTQTGRSFFQKVIRLDNTYESAYLEFPRGNKKYANVSQYLMDYFQKTSVD